MVFSFVIVLSWVLIVKSLWASREAKLPFSSACLTALPLSHPVIDATGKYPTGLFQGTLSDIGAFDQCIETVIYDDYGNEKVRAQYCNLYIKFGKDLSILEHVDDMLRLSHRRVSSPSVVSLERQSGNSLQISQHSGHDIGRKLGAFVFPILLNSMKYYV